MASMCLNQHLKSVKSTVLRIRSGRIYLLGISGESFVNAGISIFLNVGNRFKLLLYLLMSFFVLLIIMFFRLLLCGKTARVFLINLFWLDSPIISTWLFIAYTAILFFLASPKLSSFENTRSVSVFTVLLARSIVFLVQMSPMYTLLYG